MPTGGTVPPALVDGVPSVLVDGVPPTIADFTEPNADDAPVVAEPRAEDAVADADFAVSELTAADAYPVAVFRAVVALVLTPPAASYTVAPSCPAALFCTVWDPAAMYSRAVPIAAAVVAAALEAALERVSAVLLAGPLSVSLPAWPRYV